MEHLKVINSSITLVNKCIENNSDTAYQNVADKFLPIGPQTLKEHTLDWSKVNQTLIEDLYKLSIGELDRETLKKEILQSFQNSRDTRDLVNVVDELYFSSNAINSITPLAYLVSNQNSASARTTTMKNIVQGLLSSPLDSAPNLKGNNPLESLLIKNIYQLCQYKPFVNKRPTYLPFLADMFTKDIKTLSESPSYFLNELESLLSVYTFIYLTQLTIHLCISDNRYKSPSAKPLYFILETERASKERHECNQYGYDYLFSKTRGMALSIFPILGYFGRISSQPVWLASDDEDHELKEKVNEFNHALAVLFGEESQYEESLQAALNIGAAFQKQIFEESLKNSKKGSRKTANKKVVDIFEKIFAAEFITDRKAAGKYFVLNSNMLILLTNLIIEGSNETKLLIDDVIEGFKQRGIWFDLKSKKALLKFYENVGNIEKLSDSGDAVYVKTTI
tara:strand:- start:17558 stop:18910 length:1353 start_codon:yes stop_codon:yes gene_type:complete